MAQHLLQMIRDGESAFRVSKLVIERAYRLGEDLTIHPRHDGPYLKELVRMSIPDDANRRIIRRHEPVVAYLKLHPEDHELYWRTRLAATQDAKVAMRPNWDLVEKEEEDALRKVISMHRWLGIHSFTLLEAWDILIQLEILKPGMTVEEAWLGVTRYAAQAMGRHDIGVLMVGAAADLVVWDAEHPGDVPYRYGANLAHRVIKRGRIYPG